MSDGDTNRTRKEAIIDLVSNVTRLGFSAQAISYAEEFCDALEAGKYATAAAPVTYDLPEVPKPTQRPRKGKLV